MINVGLWREATIGGKSIYRILMNETLRQLQGEISGVVLDLACGREPSYWRILGLKKNEKVRLIGVEYTIFLRPTVVADITSPLPFKNKVADVVILSNFLHIPPYPESVLKEVYRILKINGLLVLTAPFIFNYRPEPTDHWRFTEEALQLLLQNSGFVDIHIVPFGNNFTAAAFLISPFLRPRRIIAPLIYWLCLKLDNFIKARFKQLPPCPLGYVVKARKAI